MLKEAEIIEQQMMLSRGGGLATGRGVGGVAQPDYSAQWAEYYRSVFVTKLMLWGHFLSLDCHSIVELLKVSW